MKKRPIIFNGEMVRAILGNKKTQTRRVIKPPPVLGKPWKDWMIDLDKMDLPKAYCPYGIPRDHLWVREKHNIECPYGPAKGCDNPDHVWYWVDEEPIVRESFTTPWRPSIFMPRWASRITLEITGVRVERVQDIILDDVIEEGIEPINLPLAPFATIFGTTGKFVRLWNSINTKRGYGWDVNPWVWVVEFQRMEE